MGRAEQTQGQIVVDDFREGERAQWGRDWISHSKYFVSPQGEMGSRRVICLSSHLKILKKGQGNKKEDQVGGPSLAIVQATGGGPGTRVVAGR